MIYQLAADVVVIVHAGYVLFVVAGQLLILAGLVLKWAWVRNPWFRVAHLSAILIVVAEVCCGITCPLTTWEHWLRTQAGQSTYQGAFIANRVHELIFIDAPPTAWMFMVCYSLFGLLVLATFIAAPPRWRPRRE
jgi:hypothetical protein